MRFKEYYLYLSQVMYAHDVGNRYGLRTILEDEKTMPKKCFLNMTSIDAAGNINLIKNDHNFTNS